MAKSFFKNWRIPMLLLALGLIPMVLSMVKLATLFAVADSGTIPPELDAPHHLTRPLPIALHIIPGILFVLSGALQFAPTVRIRRPWLHRLSGRLYIVSGVITVGAALWMNQFYPAYGGWGKYLGVLVFGIAFLICIGIALRAILQRNIARHQRWMMRAIAIGLGPGTQSLIAIPVALTIGLSDAAIGVVIPAGFIINLVFAECRILRPKAGR